MGNEIPTVCSFEENTTCTYSSVFSDFNTRWGPTPTPLTGPEGASEGFRYISWESADHLDQPPGVIKNDQGQSQRKIVPIDDSYNYCLFFNLFMWGTSGIFLDVGPIDPRSNGNSRNYTIELGRKWVQTTQEIRGDLFGSHMISIGKTSNDSYGDFAIDDFRSYARACGCYSSPCMNGGSCTDSNLGTEYECQCPQGINGTNCEILGTGFVSCTFEEDIITAPCISMVDSKGFIYGENETYTPNTGPSSGKNSASYIFVTSSPDYDDTMAYMRISNGSLNYECSTNYTLSFDYHMLGMDIGTFQLVVNDAVVLNKAGSHGDRWLSYGIEIPSVFPIDILFEYTFSGLGLERNMAIDNIQLYCTDNYERYVPAESETTTEENALTTESATTIDERATATESATATEEIVTTQYSGTTKSDDGKCSLDYLVRRERQFLNL